MPDLSTSPLIAQAASPPLHDPYTPFARPRLAPIAKMANRTRARTRHATAWIVASGIVDWLLIVATAVGGFYLGDITPNKRPFQLEDPDISFPYTVHETVSSRNLAIATVAVPVATIVIVSLVSIPGLTVPPGTPRSLIWRRKLWELYASLLAYALGMASQWFIVNGLKNVCGKPRPDLLARCQPDIQRVAQYVVGGIANVTSNGQLVSASICTNTDSSILNDGFRSYPSGHSSSSAAGLGHIALFLAFKFGVVFPFAGPPVSRESEAFSLSAFPSRLSPLSQRGAHGIDDTSRPSRVHHGLQNVSNGTDIAKAEQQVRAWPDRATFSIRRSGAAPPLYLLVVALVPFCGSVFIAASRWFNFRHHGFDILFGYFIGTVTTLIAFRMYQLPVSHGAGWAWGPRCPDKAFWAGVGSNSWAAPWHQWTLRAGDEEDAYEMTIPHNAGAPDSPVSQHPVASRRMAAGESTCVDLAENA